jgi:hypothetical protein
MVNKQQEMKDQKNVPNRRLKVSKYQQDDRLKYFIKDFYLKNK